MSTVRMGSLACIALLLLFASSAFANVTYTYTGNYYTSATWPYTTSDRITGYFVVFSALPANSTFLYLTPLDYSFTDGYQSYTTLPVDVATDSAGRISQWRIALGGFGWGTGSFNWGTNQADVGGVYIWPPGWRTASVVGDPGSWVETGAVPEPTGILLFGTGVLGLFGVVRRRMLP